MQAVQTVLRSGGPGPTALSPLPDARLVLIFGSRTRLAEGSILDSVQRTYPDAHVAGCSTAGEIAGDCVIDDSVVVTALSFDATDVRAASVPLVSAESSADAGKAIAAQLAGEGLCHVIVFSDGTRVNGSELVAGLTSELPADVVVTGGLAGDGADFAETRVVAGGRADRGLVTAVGFYGSRLRVGYGSLGGWDTFGPERTITRSEGNVLFELDGQPALDLYVRYLGDHAADLPASALLFPLSLRPAEGAEPVVRTVLGVDHSARSLTFAGDMPIGSRARLMKANFDRLIDGAVGAAGLTRGPLRGAVPTLALLISCVGRKLVLGQRIEEEVEGVRQVIGPGVTTAGFYSYGEISPFTPGAKCELHNQTMTITTLAEV